MTAPVPVTPTKARAELIDRAERLLWYFGDHGGGFGCDHPEGGRCEQSCPQGDALRVARGLAALPAEPAVPATFQQDQNWNAEPAADTRHPAEVELAVLRHTLREVLAKAEADRDRLAAVGRLVEGETSSHACYSEGNVEGDENCAACWHHDLRAALSGAAPAPCTPYCDGPCSDPCAALSPAQPDPATVERARAEGREQGVHEGILAGAVDRKEMVALGYERGLHEGREQGLREAEQAVRALVPQHRRSSDEVMVLRRAANSVRALSSATPSAPEGTA